MDHRHRVLSAVNLIEPDRVPLALWGGSYSISDALYFELVKELSLGSPLLPVRNFKGFDYNYHDDRVLEALDIDTRYVDCGFTDLGGATRGSPKDCWGVRFSQNNDGMIQSDHPLLNAVTADLKDYPFPVSRRYLKLDEFRTRAKYLKEETDYAVVGRAFDTQGPFQRCCSLRSSEKFLSDLVTDEEFTFTLIQNVTNVLCRTLEIFLVEAGPYLDIIELPGDDYTGNRPFISPKTFDRYFAPSWQIMIDMIHEAAPRCRILYHSRDNMEMFLGRLCAMGVDIIHGMDEQPGVALTNLKSRFGDRICFWGGIDPQKALSGTVEQAKDYAVQMIETLGHGGGYVLSPTSHLKANVQARNVIELFRFAANYGKLQPIETNS